MVRSLTPAIEAEIEKRSVSPRYFVELDMASTTLRMWSGVGNISWNSVTWVGGGDLANVSAVEENTDGTISSVTLTLSGVDPNLTAMAYSDEYQGRAAHIWLGFVDEAGGIIDLPIKFLTGVMDTLSDQTDSEMSIYQLVVQKGSSNQRIERVWRYTDAHQKHIHPSDTSFRFVAGLSERILAWGKRA